MRYGDCIATACFADIQDNGIFTIKPRKLVLLFKAIGDSGYVSQVNWLMMILPMSVRVWRLAGVRTKSS